MRKDECYFGTLDTYILWNLTGGINDGVHLTDVTNASRTMLMNLKTLNWDEKLCHFFQIPMSILPRIRSCAEIFGYVYEGPLKGVPIAAVSDFKTDFLIYSVIFNLTKFCFLLIPQCLTEQSGSLLGQMCIKPQQSTCYYDDGCNLLVNTGQEIIDSDNGLLTTVAFQLGPKMKPFYALEGSVAYAGSAVNWLKENLSLKDEAAPNNLVTSNGASLVQTFVGESSILSTYSSGSNLGTMTAIDTPNPASTVVFVPAMSGLYAPYWKHNARGYKISL